MVMHLLKTMAILAILATTTTGLLTALSMSETALARCECCAQQGCGGGCGTGGCSNKDFTIDHTGGFGSGGTTASSGTVNGGFGNGDLQCGGGGSNGGQGGTVGGGGGGSCPP
jgi:hypothetical protein